MPVSFSHRQWRKSESTPSRSRAAFFLEMEKSHGTVHSQAQIFLKKQQQGGSVEGESEEAAAPKRCVSIFLFSHLLQNF